VQKLVLHSCDPSVGVGQLLQQPLGLAAILLGCLLMALTVHDAKCTLARIDHLQK
jgi:hypothetical protein